MAVKVIEGYPQMPPLTHEELEIFLHHPRIARLGTLNEDGTIHMTPVFFKYDQGEFILGTQVVSRRVRNIQRNPKVTLLIDDTSPDLIAAIVYGKAELDYVDVVQKRTTIFEQFSDHEQAFKKAEGLCKKWPSVIIRIKPDRIVSYDYMKAALLS